MVKEERSKLWDKLYFISVMFPESACTWAEGTGKKESLYFKGIQIINILVEKQKLEKLVNDSEWHRVVVTRFVSRIYFIKLSEGIWLTGAV